MANDDGKDIKRVGRVGESAGDNISKRIDDYAGAVRRKKILELNEAISSAMSSGDEAHASVGMAVNAAIDAMVSDATNKDTVIDEDMLDLFIMVGANLHGIQVFWKEIQDMLKTTLR
jgi:hypothetical protein